MPDRSIAGETESEGRRRVVLHPSTARARQHDRARTFGGHVRGYTVDTDDVLSLMRRQRRASTRLLLVVVVPLIGFALALARFPSMSTIRPFGLLPLPWLVLGPVGLFTIAGLAFVHERQASRIEREWVAERRPSSASER